MTNANVNPLMVPVLLLALGFFAAGNWANVRIRSKKAWLLLLGASSLVALPGAAFVRYYAHWFDHWQWLYEWRSWRGAEFLIALITLPARFLAGKFWLLRTIFAAASLFGAFVPFAKPVLSPLERYYVTTDRWSDGVCRQTTPATCGPACTATILRHFGVETTEGAVAEQAFTYSGGTECWYLARILRNHGLHVDFQVWRGGELPDPVPVPSIAGVRIGSLGHFIAILEQTGDQVVVGEPLRGRSITTMDRLRNKPGYLTGLFMVVTSAKEEGD